MMETSNVLPLELVDLERIWYLLKYLAKAGICGSEIHPCVEKVYAMLTVSMVMVYCIENGIGINEVDAFIVKVVSVSEYVTAGAFDVT